MLNTANKICSCDLYLLHAWTVFVPCPSGGVSQDVTGFWDGSIITRLIESFEDSDNVEVLVSGDMVLSAAGFYLINAVESCDR